MSQNFSSDAVILGALRENPFLYWLQDEKTTNPTAPVVLVCRLSNNSLQAMTGPPLDRSAVLLEDIDLIWRERVLCWFGHVERSSGAVRTACDLQVEGRQGI